MATKRLQIIDSLIKQAENADTLDGKHADEFATASDVVNLQTLVGDKSVSAQIESAISSGAVKYTEQSLTADQQVQARTNIGVYDTNLVQDITSKDEVTDSAIYRINDRLYCADKALWNTDLTTPFHCVASRDFLESINWNHDKSSIYGGDTLEGIPLLKYYSGAGAGDGGLWLFLGSGSTDLIVYHSDMANWAPAEVARVALGFGIINLSEIAALCQSNGLGADVCGNWAKIQEYFLTDNISTSKIATTDYVDKTLGAVATALSEI